MTYKKFYQKLILTISFIIIIWVVLNIYIDAFGLFRNNAMRELGIYTSERLSKYLFTYRYIPSKFSGVLLGPSLSDVIDTKMIKSTSIYNLSLTGGNATELRRLFENLVYHDNKLKVLIICADPYILRKTGMEELEMDSSLLYSSFATAVVLNYGKKMLLSKAQYGRDLSYNSEWGRYHVLIPRPIIVRELIAQFITLNKKIFYEDYYVDPIALADMKFIFNLARKNNIRILAYYHPYPEPIYSILNNKFTRYKNNINQIFEGDDIVWDFNDKQYNAFKNDLTNYLDHVHLSDKGAKFIAEEIDILLKTKLLTRDTYR